MIAETTPSVNYNRGNFQFGICRFMPPVTSSAPRSQQIWPRESPSAWVLAAPGAGDNRQLETLAGLAGVRARWVGRPDPVARVLFARLTGWRAGGIAASKRETFAPPWPDLVLVAGGRSVIDALRIRRASGGRSRIVCVGRPWAPLHWFDLVITTPQYRLPGAANVLELELPLNFAEPPSRAELAHWKSEFERLPRPLLGVLLGGNSGSYRFTGACADRLVHRIERVTEPVGAGAVVVASPRTPVAAIERIGSALNVPGRVCRWSHQGPNPYRALLELADALLVTGDSASMIAEAVHTGKPVALFDLHERLRARVNRWLRRATPFADAGLRALTRRGLWFPARDMVALHRKVGNAGEIVPLDQLFYSKPGQSSAEFESTLERVVERVEALL